MRRDGQLELHARYNMWVSEMLAPTRPGNYPRGASGAESRGGRDGWPCPQIRIVILNPLGRDAYAHAVDVECCVMSRVIKGNNC